MSFQPTEISSSFVEETLKLVWQVKQQHQACLTSIVSDVRSSSLSTEKNSSVIEQLDEISAFGIWHKHLIKRYQRTFEEEAVPNQCIDPDRRIVKNLELLEQKLEEINRLNKEVLGNADSYLGTSPVLDLIINKLQKIHDDFVELQDTLQEYRWMIMIHDGLNSGSSGEWVSSGAELHAALMDD